MTASKRDFRQPPEGQTVHLIGDLQDGLTYNGEPGGTGSAQFATSMRKGRRDKIAYDWRYGDLPTPAGHLTAGDLIHRGVAAEDADVRDFLANLTANTGAPTWKVMGNHDIYSNQRSPEQWAADWGLAAPHYVVDLPFVRLAVLGIGPLRAYKDNPLDEGKCWLPAGTIEWLDARCRETSKTVWAVCHAPLRHTVAGTYTRGWLRTENDPRFTEVLAENRNLRAWISGHTHTAFRATTTGDPGTEQAGIWITTTINGRKVAHINAGCLANASDEEEILAGKAIDWATEWHEPMQTFWLSMITDTRYELRVRDHGAGKWVARSPAVGRVETVNLA